MQAMSALVALQRLNLTGCGRVQGDALTALATLSALRQATLYSILVIASETAVSMTQDECVTTRDQTQCSQQDPMRLF